MSRRANVEDRDADPTTIAGRLRRLAWRVQQGTLALTGELGSSGELAEQILDEVEAVEHHLGEAREQAEGYRDVCVDEKTCHPVECVLPWEPPELALALDGVHDATSAVMRTMRDELRKQRPAKALELQLDEEGGDDP